jgi:hypothetical protein
LKAAAAGGQAGRFLARDKGEPVGRAAGASLTWASRPLVVASMASTEVVVSSREPPAVTSKVREELARESRGLETLERVLRSTTMVLTMLL